jgi:hypothetical protein
MKNVGVPLTPLRSAPVDVVGDARSADPFTQVVREVLDV